MAVMDKNLPTKYIALTFDDGPSSLTPDILDVLESNGVRGTFFLIGQNINDDTKAIIRRQISMGCEICNHSLTHSHMSTLSKDEIVSEINTTSQKIFDVTGEYPRFFRPPFIDVNDLMYESIDLPFICGIDSVDWDSEVSCEERISNVLSQVKDGAIVLMHDFVENHDTVKALPIIIEKLKDEGYNFVTLSELFALKGVNPNQPKTIWSFV